MPFGNADVLLESLKHLERPFGRKTCPATRNHILNVALYEGTRSRTLVPACRAVSQCEILRKAKTENTNKSRITYPREPRHPDTKRKYNRQRISIERETWGDVLRRYLSHVFQGRRRNTCLVIIFAFALHCCAVRRIKGTARGNVSGHQPLNDGSNYDNRSRCRCSRSCFESRLRGRACLW